MKSDEQLWDICMKIYRALYKAAEPSADIDKLIEAGKTKTPGWFDKYYLHEKEQNKIVERIIKKYKLNEREKSKIKFNIYLGAAPTSCKKKNKSEIKTRDKIKF